MTNILVTGSGGFTARFLFPELEKQWPDFQLHGLDLNPPKDCLGMHHKGSLLDEVFLRDLIRNIEPEIVFHLVGLRSADLVSSIRLNVLTTISLLGGLRSVSSTDPKVLLVGSAAQYGHPMSLPITEDHPQQPISVYGKTKLWQEELASSFVDEYDMKIVMTRVFNLIGPGQPTTFVCGRIAAQFADMVEKQEPRQLRIRSLASTRDFLDVRDAVRVYCLLLKVSAWGQPFNVCSGQETSLSDLIDEFTKVSNLRPRINCELSKSVVVGIDRVYGDIKALKQVIRWERRFLLQDSVRDILSFFLC